MTTHDALDEERAFWAMWRIRWLHKLGVAAATSLLLLLTFSCIDDSGWARAKREKERVTFNNALEKARRDEDYRTMATWCRAQLRLVTTRKDSARVLASNHTYGFANETGFICENWIAGERSNVKR